jgi:hypothetical protein
MDCNVSRTTFHLVYFSMWLVYGGCVQLSCSSTIDDAYLLWRKCYGISFSCIFLYAGLWNVKYVNIILDFHGRNEGTVGNVGHK